MQDDSDKKQFFRNFTSTIDVYPNETEDGRLVKYIGFKFPVDYDEEKDNLWLPKRNDIETCVLLGRK